MSIKYTIVANPLQPGQFYPRPVGLDTRDLPTLIRNVAKTSTISPADTKAVVEAFIEEIIEGMVDGDRVSIDGLADFRPRMSQVLLTASDNFDASTGGQILIAATIKPSVTRRVRENVQIEKVVTGDKQPLPKSFFDPTTKQSGLYSAGSIGKITGDNLKISDESAPDEGVFFVSQSDGTETKVQVYENNANRRLVFQVPAGLTGLQNVEVRTRFTPGGKLRRGSVEDLAPA